MAEYDSKEQREIGSRIRQLVKESGLTRLEVSERANMGIKTLRKYINGQGFPKAQEVIRLCNVLKASPNYLLTGSDEFEPQEVESEKLGFQSVMRQNMKLAAYVSELNKSDARFVERVVKSMLATRLSSEQLADIEQRMEMYDSPEFGNFLDVLFGIVDKRKGMPPE